ncbi:MAG: tyrosine-type recombinase/integrase [Chloroflexi bacterium]|nr:tyrosine-type recombinase/integrase [Chloroflexota bacterium]
MEQDLIGAQALQQVSEKTRQRLDLLDDTLQAPAEQTDESSTVMGASNLVFSQIAALLFEELPSESSRRVYRNTFQQWEQFALHNNLNVMDLFYRNIKGFLYSRNLSYKTRVSRKSHMQRLLRMASYRDPSFGIHYIQLRDLKIQRTSSDSSPRRKPRLLSRKECRKLLSVWKNDDTDKGIRNYAVICLLLYAAVRNAELVGLRWEDLNWDAQTLTVCRGNERQICILSILDTTSETLNSLRRLQDAQKSVRSYRDIPYRHIFPALSTGKNARFQPGKDVHTSPQTIRVIVKQTAEKAGLGHLSSLDLRFTSRNMFSKAGVSRAGNSSSADS